MIRNATRAFLFALLVFVPAFASASDNFTALLNIPLTVTGPDNQCRIVNNASPTGKSVYVPTNSILEWQSFVGHPPTGVSLASNVYNRRNIFYYDRILYKRVNQLPIMPTISLNWTF
jgi:hypothetical protein